MGYADQRIRYVLAVAFLLIAFFGVNGVWQWVFGLLGAVMVATAGLNFCPVWAALKINTRGKAA
ncbi:hypothetical protein Mterra_01265 [Calidithermus terrae]|uniref:Inner membrane protein YgaP-like transmembrane domain-containing protein n=1 Tax=Calidithermus terrae TaxID=1408545 RepID=A0A399EU18_9DEIN|nr:hypothetical protein Mterra_01265 [Calidithermus terrae]